MTKSRERLNAYIKKETRIHPNKLTLKEAKYLCTLHLQCRDLENGGSILAKKDAANLGIKI